MKLKKILILSLIFIAVAGTLTAVSADDDNDNVVNVQSSSRSGSMTLVNNDLTLEGLKFNIPDDFEEVESKTELDADGEDIDGTRVDSEVKCEFKNNANQQIDIKVGSKNNNEKITELNLANAEKKKIGSKEGYFFRDDDEFVFEYLDDGKLVKVETTTEELLNQVIV